VSAAAPTRVATPLYAFRLCSRIDTATAKGLAVGGRLACWNGCRAVKARIRPNDKHTVQGARSKDMAIVNRQATVSHERFES
jgi:hypothetical protein